MDAAQKQKLSALLAQQHVAVVATRGEEWPTTTVQAFAETPEFEIVLIMLESAPKFQNLKKRPQITLHIDNRDKGDVTTLQITRAWIEGIACEVAKGSAEWETSKGIFLKKNPFEEPFFTYDVLRMVRVTPKRVSYANGLADSFKADV
jgi:nitroimidazol reductase NimA-like FMN-containing flavoprotein (pyridoxamine 5'-phosphate oxidase superfamily)